MRGKRAEPASPKAPPKGAVREINDDDLRALAANHRPKFEKALANKKAADKALQDLGKLIKADLGDTGLAIIKAMIELDTPEGEAKVKARVAAQATALKWQSHELGTQILLALDEPDRTPAVDRAFEEGKKASLEGKPRKPSYDPSTPQYASYMAGYDKDQERSAQTIGRGKPDDGTKDLRPRHLRELDEQRKAEEAEKLETTH